MIKVGTTYGGEEQAKPLIVGKTLVYVHTNIEKVEKDQEGNPVDNLYKYDEVTYDKDEWIKLQSEQSEEIQSAIDYLLMNS